jgi:hypothetical protein
MLFVYSHKNNKSRAMHLIEQLVLYVILTVNLLNLSCFVDAHGLKGGILDVFYQNYWEGVNNFPKNAHFIIFPQAGVLFTLYLTHCVYLWFSFLNEY